MSQTLLQEARTIGEQLSVLEKIQLIEWLSAQLRQEFDTPQRTPALGAPAGTDELTNGHGNAQHYTTVAVTVEPAIDEVPPTWTDEEIQAMMKPSPKTGAEIAAMLESGEIDTSVGAELEIDNVVTWLEDLRRQERIERGLEG